METWSVGQLNELLSELEWRVQHHSETLIAELALRDELEYEKELKNTFISLLLNVQNKRRQMTANQKKPSTNATTPTGTKNGNKTGSGFSQFDCKVRTLLPPLMTHSLLYFTTVWWESRGKTKTVFLLIYRNPGGECQKVSRLS